MTGRSIIRTAVAAATALTISAAPAVAQTFTFSTNGIFNSAFAGCNGSNVCVMDGGLSLTFDGVPSNTYLSGSQLSLGNFTPAGTGSTTVPPPDVMFTLFINQTSPSNETGEFIGAITGRIVRGPGGDFSSLVWTPNEVIQLGLVNYDLIFDDTVEGIRIGASFATSVNAVGTVVPEPATVILLATGLAGVGLVGLRRRRSSTGV